MFSNTEGYVLKYRRACSQMQKGMFSNTERHVLKYRKACSQIQKGPFFCLNTHASHSCGAKQIYIKIKYSSPSHASHSPPPISLPLLIHPQPIPSPHTFRSQPTHLLPPSHSPSVRSPLPPLRYSPNLFICYPVFYYKQHIPLSTRSPVHLPHSPVSSRIQLVHSSPRQLVNLPVTHRTCSSVTLSPLATNLFPCLLVNSSTYNVTHRTCSPVTMSINTTNLFPCPLVNPSSCKLFLLSYFFVGTCPKHCNANSSLFVTHFYRQKNNYQ